VSDEAIDTGIDPDEFAERMLAAIDAGQREVAIAEHGMEQMIAEARRTPEELFDRMIATFNSGYAAKMGVSEQ
jgi:DNA-binding IclR family transcriptional regulator